MHKIQIGSSIFTRDGRSTGEVDRVVVDPATGRVTHLIGRAKDLLFHDVVLPIETVRDRREWAVTLELDAVDLERMPDYVEADYVTPAPEDLPAGPYRHGEVLFPVARVGFATAQQGDLPLGKKVECLDGLCGVVDEIRLDPVSGRVLSFHLRRAGSLTRDVVVPVEWVLDVRGERLRLDCNVGQLEEELPPAEAIRKTSA